MAIERAYKFRFFISAADGLIKAGIFYFISRHLSPDYFGYVFAGIVFGRFFHYFVSAFTNFIKHEQHRGTMDMLAASTAGLPATVYAAVAAGLPRFAMEMSVLAAAGAALGLSAKISALPEIAAMAVITSVFFAATGIAFAGLAFDVKRSEQSGWLFASLIEILSGVYFPAAALPAALGAISARLPTTILLNMWRAAMEAKGNGLVNIALAAAVSAISLSAADFYFRGALRRAMKRGDATVY
jgi:ABC-type polysaccharide/polyol phosphate export permease